MQFVGGKYRLRKFLADNILPLRKERLLEPFCGGLWATTVLKPDIASDCQKGLIMLYQAVREGWQPPTMVTEDDYRNARNLPDDSPYKTFVGYACSWGGKWFAGYARGAQGSNYAAAGASTLLRKIEQIKGVGLAHCSYDEVQVQPGDLIYCDPPYADVTQGYNAPKFDTPGFWQWCRDAANKGACVIVSEFKAPEDIPTLAVKESKTDLHTKHRSNDTLEHLFILDGRS